MNEDMWDYEKANAFVAPPPGRLIVKRDNKSITRKIPKPIILVDTREQLPFEFLNVPNWIEKRKRRSWMWVTTA